MNDPFRFSITPFLNTRQFYVGLENGQVDPGFPIAVEHNHSPVKDQKLVCGCLEATTLSMGKYVTLKLVSHTDALPVDPVAVAAGLTYREGNGTFVHVGSGLDEPQDLVGARVGIHDRTLAMTYHKTILEERFDILPDDVEWVVDTHHRLTERFEQGDVDAVERVNDWYWDLREDDDYRLLYDMGQEYHAITGRFPVVHLVSVDGDLYREQPRRIAAFVEALGRSRDYREEHYESILEALVTEGDSEWNDEHSLDTLRRATRGVDCPFHLGREVRATVVDWMERAARYGVFQTMPLTTDRLFPDPP